MFHDFDVGADAKSVSREACSRPLGPGHVQEILFPIGGC